MGLGRGFAPPVLGPIHAIGHQFQHGSVHYMDGQLEPKSWPATAAARKARRLCPQVLQHPPEQLLGQFGWPLPIGVRQSVTTWRGGSAHAGQAAGMQLQRIAQVVQADAMAQLRIDKANHMAPRRERARLVLDPSGSRQPGHQMRRNKIANLPQDVELRPCWVDVSFFHPLPCGRVQTSSQHFFHFPVGWL